jgi:hypothetical protein
MTYNQATKGIGGVINGGRKKEDRGTLPSQIWGLKSGTYRGFRGQVW